MVAFEYQTTSKATPSQEEYEELAQVTADVMDELYEWFYSEVAEVDYYFTNVEQFTVLAPRALKYGVSLYFKLPSYIPTTTELDAIATQGMAQDAEFARLYVGHLRQMNSPVFSTTTSIRFINDEEEVEEVTVKPIFGTSKNLVPIIVPSVLGAVLLCFCCVLYRYCIGESRAMTMDELRDLEYKASNKRANEDGESSTYVSDYRTATFSEDHHTVRRIDTQDHGDDDNKSLKSMTTEMEEVMDNIKNLEDVSLDDEAHDRAEAGNAHSPLSMNSPTTAHRTGVQTFTASPGRPASRSEKERSVLSIPALSPKSPTKATVSVSSERKPIWSVAKLKHVEPPVEKKISEPRKPQPPPPKPISSADAVPEWMKKFKEMGLEKHDE